MLQKRGVTHHGWAEWTWRLAGTGGAPAGQGAGGAARAVRGETGKGPDVRIFALTGAGISAESGLGTFREKGGLWDQFDPMQLATPEAFARDPEKVHGFYNLRRRNLGTAVPNEAHRALARLERELEAQGGSLFLCTQNIDDLHERAGSRCVHHMHGELLKVRCLRCGTVVPWHGNLSILDHCTTCGRDNCLRPDIVWFGEMPYGLEMIDAMLHDADLFVAIGTSGAVYPAAGYVALARDYGLHTCEINLEASDTAGAFDEHVYGPATETVPAFVERLLHEPVRS